MQVHIAALLAGFGLKGQLVHAARRVSFKNASQR
jgi:hypothetical protein